MKTEVQGITSIKGVLEIDHARGVIWFNAIEGGCRLRICKLPAPIPQPASEMLDITFGYGCDWGEEFEKRRRSGRGR